VRLSGQPVHALKGREKARFHAQVQMIFQDPVSSLNPRKTVRQILEAPLIVLLGMAGPRRRERLSELMDLVALRAEFLDRYPHEFSGGQAQRIGIARALAAEPRLLIMDEPVSALDVSIQAQVIKLLRRLQGELGLTYVFISHDMAVIEDLCDDVVVMRQGQIVERGARERLFRAPEHSYTRLLLRSVPVPGRRQALAEVAG
jgi:peptide/nickel transport system ATP-binding protein